MVTVAEVMTPEPYTLTPAHNLRDAAEIMRDHHIRHIPLLRDDGGIAGIVSQRDVLAASHASLAMQSGQNDGGSYAALEAIMSTPVLTTSEHDSLASIALRLRQHRIACMPVLREGRLVGIISDSDFLEVSMDLLEKVKTRDPETLT